MPSVDAEIKLQNKVKHWLKDDLDYDYIGNFEDTDNEPIIIERLESNLEKRGYSMLQIKRAVDALVPMTRNQTDSLYQINEDIYSKLRYGAQGVKDEHGVLTTVYYIDWGDVSNNDFCFAEEVTVLRYDQKTRKRPDLVLYVNGIALGMIELKSSCVSVGEGIRQLITNQEKENIQNFFSTVQLLMAGNEAEGLRYGVIDTPEKYYLTWREDPRAKDELSKSIRKLQEENPNRLRDGLVSLLQHDRFLSMIYEFMIYDAGYKKTARHNQYFANIAARERIKMKEGGIIWNTQGSGKSLIMVWLTKWIRENIDNSRVVIVTDREELDDQIESLFQDVGEKKVKRAKSCSDLREILNKNEDPIVCSLIHKYGHNAGKQADIDQYCKELLKDLPKDYKAKGNIIAFIDECHRTNSGKLHKAVELLMPDAVLIGFTGTPLLKTDKETSLEVFGSYIHTYKFNEGVEDGVVLDLRYEARDIDQELTSQEKVDQWFDLKTSGLTARAKQQIKSSWSTISKLYSSKQRLERIAADIIFDMSDKARLASDRGTAMLVADSVYEACKYWDIFTSNGFTKCAVVTSYEPTTASVRTATSMPGQMSEEKYKKSIYDRMLNGKKVSEYEAEVKELFKKKPAQMKLLIVVDKLLTGFDAPSATYLYIDKKMRDHDLFQAICRVNRPDGEDKDYGFIVDYMDLFRNIQLAVADYTSEAFDGFDKEDIDGLIKNRYDEAKSEMAASRKSLEEQFANVNDPKDEMDYIEYYCGSDSEDSEKIARRDTLYALVASLSRSFANCCEKLVSDYGYTETQVNDLRNDISGYNKIKEMIKLASCDYIDQKPYEADMRYILDTYIRAEDSKVISRMNDMSLVQLLIEGKTTTPADLVKGLPGDNKASAEMIDNNLKYEIVKKMDSNRVYYGKLSEMLEDVIMQRKIGALSYEEYLRHVVELAKKILHPEEDDTYPEKIRDSSAKRALYDYFQGYVDLIVELDYTIRITIEPFWRESLQKQQDIRIAIYEKLINEAYEDKKNHKTTLEVTDDVFDIAKGQAEYDN